MKKFMILIISIIFLISCASKMQLIEVKNESIILKDDKYLYQDINVDIGYDFWGKNGIMQFYVFNKSNKPIYIDWKKSSFVYNDIKQSYWFDKDELKTNSYEKKYYDSFFKTINTNSKLYGSIYRPERISFIPPLSTIYNPLPYKILFNQLDMKNAIPVTILSPILSEKTKNKLIKVLRKNFDNKNSPVIFRNFLTLSFKENFEEEFYIDSTFWISEINLIDECYFSDQRQIKNYDENKEDIYYEKSILRKPNKFYSK
ncbi:MAG TPA: hypothetical protein PKY81_10450 [bacterium]|nr:hypothetical protein [bacterium]HPN31367.1 hypothetical protein [bacterium]